MDICHFHQDKLPKHGRIRNLASTIRAVHRHLDRGMAIPLTMTSEHKSKNKRILSRLSRWVKQSKRNVKTDNQAQDQYWQKMFSKVAAFPYSWLGKATELLDAANLAVVRESEEPHKGSYRNIAIYMMLTAFAFEDIFKAIVLKREPDIINNINRKRKLFSGHDLCHLAVQAKVSLTPDETNLLRHLSQWVYGGRYPIPKDWVNYKGALDGSGSVVSGVYILPRDFIAITNFIHKLEGELKSLGVDCDLYDLSYSFVKDGKSLFVKRSINPHPFNDNPF